MVSNRTKALNVRMLESEAAMLADLATHEGVSISEWVRNIIRREHALTLGTRPPPRKRPKK
jgi:predicted HicB family RNase H-like nuclease